MKPGDRGVYVRDADSAPVGATVAKVYPGSSWVGLVLDSGERIESTFVASSPYQSPRGDCFLATTP